jgi:hypothetical protein
MMTPAGWVTTIGGLAGVSGSADGIGNAARFNHPTGVAVDRAGSVYVADSDNHRISKGTPVAAPKVDDGSPWARRVAKTSLADDELAMGLAIDSTGSLYVAGWFDGVNDFGGRTLTSYGGQDAFLAKYNSTGELQWVRQAGGNSAGWDCARGVGVDASGNAYVTGGFLGSATFGGTPLTSLHNQDCFLAKYSPGGTLQWVKQGSDSSHSAYGTGIAVDLAGNSLVVGYFEGQKVSFGAVTATNVGYSGGASAAFLVKYDSTGAAQWARGLGGGETYSTTVGVDAAGDCYVAGDFKGTLQLGATSLTSAGDKDGFLAKFNSVGVLQWTRQVAGIGGDGGRLGVDAAGNSWYVGHFTGSASIGTTNLTSPSGYGFFVARFDTSGNLQWIRRADGTSFLGSEGGCAVDAAGNCYIPGIYSGTVDFGGTIITNRGGWDIFAAKYDGAGNLQWVQTGGGTGNDGALRAAVNTTGNCYLAGWFQGTALIGTNALTSQGYRDVFVARLAAVGAQPLAGGREWHTATLLPNGKVLVAGGYTGNFPNGTYLNTAELYDTVTRNWASTGAPANPRGRHTDTLLLNGKVLIAGGAGPGGPLRSAELYDAARGTWTMTGLMNTTRGVHSATLLVDGRVLVAGGTSDGVNALASAEIYDPITGNWTTTAAMMAARCYPTATLLPDGRVLVAGGAIGPRDNPALASAEVYDLATGKWAATSAMAKDRQAHTATMLPNGRVLVVGGEDSSGTRLSSVEIYDPATGTWTATGALANGRKWHTANLLPNGKVLVVGGAGNAVYPADAELYDPATGTWAIDGRVNTPRYWHTATLLPNGKVLIAGGGTGDNSAFASTELYDSAPGTVTAVALKGLAMLPGDAFQFSFTNTPGLSFGVLRATDLSVSGGGWSVVGAAMEFWPGQYRFTDTQAGKDSHQFYRVVTPNP